MLYVYGKSISRTIQGRPHKLLDVQILVTSQHTFFNNRYRVQCLHGYVTKEHSVVISQTCSRPQNIWKGWLTAFLTVQKHLYGEIFVQWCNAIIVRGSLSRNTSKVCLTTLGTILHRDLQCTSVQGISVRQNDVWRQWSLWTICDCWYRTKRTQGGSVCSKKTQELQKIFHREARIGCFTITWVYGSVSPVGCPISLPRNRRGVGWAFTCFENLAEAGQSGSGTSVRVTRLLYTNMTQTKQQSSVWLFTGKNPLVKFKRSRSTSKQMIAVFFAKSGHVASVPLQ